MAILADLERAEGLTEAEASIAGYIVENADAVCHMGIVELSEASHSSNASIARLCQKLGLSGYRALRIELAADLERRRRERSDVDINRPFGANESIEDVMSGIASLTKEAVDTCYASVHPGDVERLARAIYAARRVLVFAVGDSEISCIAFANQLMKLGANCIIAEQYRETGAMARSVRPGDLVLMVGYSDRRVRELEPYFPLFAKRRASTALISSARPTVPVRYVVRFPPKEAEVGKVATYYSQTCITYILNCVYGKVFQLDYELNMQRRTFAESPDPN